MCGALLNRWFSHASLCSVNAEFENARAAPVERLAGEVVPVGGRKELHGCYRHERRAASRLDQARCRSAR